MSHPRWYMIISQKWWLEYDVMLIYGSRTVSWGRSVDPCETKGLAMLVIRKMNGYVRHKVILL